jgi:hypothetical protein
VPLPTDSWRSRLVSALEAIAIVEQSDLGTPGLPGRRYDAGGLDHPVSLAPEYRQALYEPGEAALDRGADRVAFSRRPSELE